MKFYNFEVQSSPEFRNVVCPKHRKDMLQLANGWFSCCWYCEECGYPYELELRKMTKVNQENLATALEKARKIKQRKDAIYKDL